MSDVAARIEAFLRRLRASGYVCQVAKEADGQHWYVTDKDGKKRHSVWGLDDYRCAIQIAVILHIALP